MTSGRTAGLTVYRVGQLSRPPRPARERVPADLGARRRPEVAELEAAGR
jgi:hypothetical protein